MTNWIGFSVGLCPSEGGLTAKASVPGTPNIFGPSCWTICCCFTSRLSQSISRTNEIA